MNNYQVPVIANDVCRQFYLSKHVPIAFLHLCGRLAYGVQCRRCGEVGRQGRSAKGILVPISRQAEGPQEDDSHCGLQSSSV